MAPDTRLSDMYARRGVNLRKHLGEYPTWTARVPTVVDLSAQDKRVLREGGDAALEERLRAQGQYPFPALSLRQLKALYLDTVLADKGKAQVAIVAGSGEPCRKLAAKIQRFLAKTAGTDIPVLLGTDFRESDLSKKHIVVVGASHENEAAALLADRCVLNADARLPGPHGLLVRTAHNPFNRGHNVVQVCCGTGREKEALAILRKALRTSQGRTSVQGPLFAVNPDPRSYPALADKPTVLRGLAGKSRYWQKSDAPRRLTRAAQLVEPIAKFYDSGGKEGDRYNRAPMTVFNAAAEIYGITGDRDYLELFKGLLWGMLQYYCAFPGGASIISDMEFDLCWLMIHWDMLEEDPAFDDEERLILTNFLLASTEMCAGYKAERWPTAPGEFRHNHETFGALALLFSGRYFRDYYQVPAAGEWVAIADECFRGPIETHFKYREDANMYQWLVPSHKVLYDRVAGRKRFVSSGNLAKVAHNIEVTTDNFGYPCDFGDAGSPLTGGATAANLLTAAAGAYRDGKMQWLADRIRNAHPSPTNLHILSGSNWLPASNHVQAAKSLPCVPLDKMPLDDHIRTKHAPHMKRAECYDKIAFREAWTKDAQYLLLDGYSADSHCHHDQNAVIRFNQSGRLWLVDNGYGKRSGVTKVGEAFSTRERGPQDHNTLLFVQPGGQLALPPPLCSLRAYKDLGPMAVVRSALLGYAGADWTRTFVWVKGRFFLVADQVSLGDEPLAAVKCQWNGLGELDFGQGRAQLEQDGRRCFLQWDAAFPAEASSYMNQSWEAELRPEIYPYAKPPVKKIDVVAASPAQGSALSFATLFYGTKASKPTFELKVEGPGRYVVTGGRLKGLEAKWKSKGSEAVLEGGRLIVICS